MELWSHEEQDSVEVNELVAAQQYVSQGSPRGLRATFARFGEQLLRNRYFVCSRRAAECQPEQSLNAGGFVLRFVASGALREVFRLRRDELMVEQEQRLR